MQEFLAILLVVAGLIASAFTIHTVIDQDHALRTFQPQPATITSSEIQIAHSYRSTTWYTPAITYTYPIAQATLTSSQLFPVDTSGNYAWAKSVAKQFPPGAHVTAYVDPTNPDHAFLLHNYLFAPYLYAVASLLAVSTGILLLSSAATLWRAQNNTISVDPEWSLLLPTAFLRDSFRKSLLSFLTFSLATGLFLGHYLLVARPQNPDAWLLTFAAIVISALLLTFTITRWNLSHHINDARISVHPFPMQRSLPLQIKCELDARTTLHVNTMRITIRCTEEYIEREGLKPVTKTRTLAEQTAILVNAETQRTLLPSQILTAQTTLSFAGETLPPSPDPEVPSPTWELLLTVHFNTHPTYHATFPLRVT